MPLLEFIDFQQSRVKVAEKEWVKELSPTYCLLSDF